MSTALRPPTRAEPALLAPPVPVHLASALLVLALLSGVAEGLARSLPTGSYGELGPRLAIYALVGAVVLWFHSGRRWAHWSLLLGIGVVGTASLLIEPVTWALTGPDVVGAMGGMAASEWAAATARVVHVVAVLAAVALMLHPSTCRYVRTVSDR